MKNSFCLFLFIAFNLCLKICYSQELKSIQLTQREKKDKVIGKYTYSGAEEHVVMLLYQNGGYTYNTFRNNIGKRFSEGSWRSTNKILELNSTYGANRLPVKINYVQKLNKSSRIGIHHVLNSKGEVIENAIISINNDSITCSVIMDTCIGNYKNIERVKVFVGCGECYSGWIEINRTDFKALDIIILPPIEFDKYVAFNGKKYSLSRYGLKEYQIKTPLPKFINWDDSVSVKTYLKASSLCDNLNLIRDSLILFVAGKGYSLKVLESITKETHENISIPIATGNVILTEEYKKQSLKEQINSIQKKHCK